MQVPAAFHKFCGYFFQDIGLVKPDPQEWVTFAAGHLSETEIVAVKEYLDELLSGVRDGDEMQRIWFDSGAEIMFADTDRLRGFLILARDTIDAKR